MHELSEQTRREMKEWNKQYLEHLQECQAGVSEPICPRQDSSIRSRGHQKAYG